MCEYGRPCSCFMRGYRRGYVDGYVDGYMGVSPLPQFKEEIVSLTKSFVPPQKRPVWKPYDPYVSSCIDREIAPIDFTKCVETEKWRPLFDRIEQDPFDPPIHRIGELVRD